MVSLKLVKGYFCRAVLKLADRRFLGLFGVSEQKRKITRKIKFAKKRIFKFVYSRLSQPLQHRGTLEITLEITQVSGKPRLKIAILYLQLIMIH